MKSLQITGKVQKIFNINIKMLTEQYNTKWKKMYHAISFINMDLNI